MPETPFFPEAAQDERFDFSTESAELGRYLFYDPILSLDSSISCASCHRQAVAFSDAPNALSYGVMGNMTSRNTLPLFNLAWYDYLFWDGRAQSLRDQVFHPLQNHNEMNLDWATAAQRLQFSEFYKKLFHRAFGNIPIDSNSISRAIADFERTLISNQSKYDSVLRGMAYFTPEEYEGFVLVVEQHKGNCLHCHTVDQDALGTSTGFSNNGLDTASVVQSYIDPGRGGVTKTDKDMGLFRIPSLRNVALTAPYMHDGRFNTLQQVVDFYSEGVHNSLNIDSKMRNAKRGGVQLTEKEKSNIIAFLHTLTDYHLISEPEFSNPFSQKQVQRIHAESIKE